MGSLYYELLCIICIRSVYSMQIHINKNAYQVNIQKILIAITDFLFKDIKPNYIKSSIDSIGHSIVFSHIFHIFTITKSILLAYISELLTIRS